MISRSAFNLEIPVGMEVRGDNNHGDNPTASESTTEPAAKVSLASITAMLIPGQAQSNWTE
jgi:hypothetical protein